MAYRLLPRQPLLVVLLLPPLCAAPAWAGNATAESVWDRNDARQRALQQVPRGATVTGTQCKDISVSDDSRYRCTVFFAAPPSHATPPSGAKPDPAHPRP
jgi:hypothetical protein